MSSVIKVRCPACRSLFRAPADELDRPVRCPNCSKQFRAAPKKRTPTPPAASTPVPTAPTLPELHTVTPPPRPAAAPAVPAAPTPASASPGANPFAFDSGPVVRPVLPVAAYRDRPASPLAKALMVLAFATVIALAAGAGFYFQDLFGRDSGNAEAKVKSEEAEPPADSATKSRPTTVLPTAAEHFPRRLLAVGVHQYLYANPTAEKGFAQDIETLRRYLRIDPDQSYVLSDSLTGADARLPLKPVIELAVERFLATSRPQDRVFVLFAGHALDVDGQPYLVPLEGELTVKETLIPLSWLYDRLATCPARQKLLVMDVCRLDSASGQERPGSGPMGPKLAAALAAPPPGVQVWSACAAGQFSYEYDYATQGHHTVQGGAFLSLMAQAFRAGGGLPKPDDPLPLAFLESQVNGPLRELVRAREKAEQTPRLAGEEPAGGAAYDPGTPPPPRFELPRPETLLAGGRADPGEVRTIFAEVAVPPLKLPRAMDRAPETPQQQAARLAAMVPFRAEALKPYAADGVSARQILDDPKQFPLRAAVLRTVEALDRQGRLNRIRLGDKEEKADRLMEVFRGKTTDALKKSLTTSQQNGPAKMLVELQDLQEQMEKAGAERAREPSKRWQAHYDYVLAQLLARMVYVNEYNTMLGKVKREELPPLDPKLHQGWRLAAQEKVQSAKEVRELAEESKRLLGQVIKDHPGTPWEVLAKRARLTALGLAWQPASFDDSFTRE